MQEFTATHVPPWSTHGSLALPATQAFPFWLPLLLHVPITSKRAMRTSFAVQIVDWDRPAASRRQSPPLVAARAVPIACSERTSVRTVETRRVRGAAVI